MKFDTLSVLACMPWNNINSLKVYYKSYSSNNLILNILDLENMTEEEGDLVAVMEQNEEVKKYCFEGKELKVVLK